MTNVLIICHEPEAAPGLIGEMLQARGIATALHVVLDDPDEPNVNFDAVMSFGSFCNAYDKSARSWVEPEVAFITSMMERDVPYLGVCFGGQLLAETLGGQVEKAPLGMEEIGLIHLEPITGDLPIPAGPWFTWHEDRTVLPAGVEVLARTPNAVQLFRKGRAVGTQFHPEADVDLVAGWAALGPDHIPEHTTARELLTDLNDSKERLRGNCEQLVDWFLGDVAGVKA